MGVVKLDHDVVALYSCQEDGSRVVLFQRNVGIVAKLQVPEKGTSLEDRLRSTMRRVLSQNDAPIVSESLRVL